MTDPIRMLHFADVHIGMENYGQVDPTTGTSSRVRDFLDRLDEVIDYGLDHEVDLAVFAGDAFKSRDPDPTHQREFAVRIKRLADYCPTLLLVGNHDMPGSPARANSVDIFRALQVPNVIVGHRAEGQVVETRRGPVYLAWVPYPMRNRLLSRKEHQGKTIDELEQLLRQTVSDIVRQLAEQAIDQPMPRVLAGHFSVAEAKLGSERSVMLGRDVAVNNSTLAESAWDYVALGHIHKHQVLNPGGYPPVVYAGSLERIDFGEEGEDKGFCWVELERGGTTWNFVPVHARPFHTIRVDARQAADPTMAVREQAQSVDPGAVLRILVQLRSDQEAAFREREVIEDLADASSVQIGREIEESERSRLGDIAPESLNPLELLALYFEARQVEPERAGALLDRARRLFDMDQADG
ncbi:MAG: exonuclease SbcCD subunit D [Anaerolineales bacterium]